MTLSKTSAILALLAALLPPFANAEAPDVVFADFEAETFGDWEATGKAFGDGPAQGPLPGQMSVKGYQGKRLVNSFHGGDDAKGRLTSPEFVIKHKYISFLIGGGGFAGKTCLDLVVGGVVARTGMGQNTAPGGSEDLWLASWDVADLLGKTARLVVVDEAAGGWGHLNVDQIVFTDAKPRSDALDPSRTLLADRRFLNLPIKNGAKKRQVSVTVGGAVVRRFEAELADHDPDWWAVLDGSPWHGKELTVRVDRLPGDSDALKSLAMDDAIKGSENLYKEALRPQFHFSAKRGWLNDPNGLVFLDGEYHLFFQHNPYGAEWGNMHWGHAVARDLVHWEELGEALYPDDFGAMFSGSAVVDRADTSELGREGKGPLVLIYTANGQDVQCLASSTDRGRSFAKLAGNPVVPKITGGNRDPKVCWHAPSRRWIMALYVERPGTEKAPAPVHTVQFLSSADLREWKAEGEIAGFFECPDLFELPMDGDPSRSKWVLTAASSEYMVGAFDGHTFTPETPKLPGHRGKGSYAAQTFADIPETDGRRLQIGWLQAPSPGMPFNQAMSLPLVLTLRKTPEGPRLAWEPAAELKTLRSQSHKIPAGRLAPGDDPLSGLRADLIEIRAEFEPGDAAEVLLKVRGIPIIYEARTREVVVNGQRAPASARGEVQKLAIFLDRTTLEVFAGDGLTYVPIPIIAPEADRGLSLTAKGGTARIKSLEVFELGSAWPARE